MGGDDDLVGVVVRDPVHRGLIGIRIHHLAGRVDALLAQLGQRDGEPVLGRCAHELVVDHVAVPRLVLRADHDHVHGTLLGGLLHGLDQSAPADGLVCDDEDCLHAVVVHSVFTGGGAPPPAAVVAGTRSLKTPCTAPGTPYSYGPPTTVGTSSKLKTGGGEDTCHSSVCARHGLATATGPCRQLV